MAEPEYGSNPAKGLAGRFRETSLGAQHPLFKDYALDDRDPSYG